MRFELSKTTGRTTHSFDIKANSLADAESYRDANFQGYSIVEVPEYVMSSAEKRRQRAELGSQLYEQYLDENDQIAKDRGYAFTVEEANTQAAKLQLIGLHLKNGSFVQAIEMLSGTAPDAILTQDRINYFIAEMQDLLNNQ